MCVCLLIFYLLILERRTLKIDHFWIIGGIYINNLWKLWNFLETERENKNLSKKQLFVYRVKGIKIGVYYCL